VREVGKCDECLNLEELTPYENSDGFVSYLCNDCIGDYVFHDFIKELEEEDNEELEEDLDGEDED
jgi:hypothetical protein